MSLTFDGLYRAFLRGSRIVRSCGEYWWLRNYDGDYFLGAVIDGDFHPSNVFIRQFINREVITEHKGE